MKFFEVVIFSFVHKVRTIETRAFARREDAERYFGEEREKAVLRAKECVGESFTMDDDERYFSVYDDTCQDFEISISIGEKTMA